MPNRTIYLPADLDDLARQLDLNLSRLTQEAIRLHAGAQDQRSRRVDHLVDTYAQIAEEVDYSNWTLDELRALDGDDAR